MNHHTSIELYPPRVEALLRLCAEVHRSRHTRPRRDATERPRAPKVGLDKRAQP